MGVKRPDQIPMEPSSTDKKTRTDDEHIHEEDKQLLHTRRGKLDMPKKGEDNPALADLKARRAKGEKEGSR